MEVLAGAVRPELEEMTEARFIRPLERRRRVFTPTHDAWKRAAAALTPLLRERKVSPDGIKRSLINDLLIAASARDHGFVLVTDTEQDLELVSDILPMDFVPPWPDCTSS